MSRITCNSINSGIFRGGVESNSSVGGKFGSISGCNSICGWLKKPFKVESNLNMH